MQKAPCYCLLSPLPLLTSCAKAGRPSRPRPSQQSAHALVPSSTLLPFSEMASTWLNLLFIGTCQPMLQGSSSTKKGSDRHLSRLDNWQAHIAGHRPDCISCTASVITLTLYDAIAALAEPCGSIGTKRQQRLRGNRPLQPPAPYHDSYILSIYMYQPKFTSVLLQLHCNQASATACCHHRRCYGCRHGCNGCHFLCCNKLWMSTH